MRADVNLSVRPSTTTELGTRTEMKNINSFKAIARAIEGERKRQIEVLEEGGRVIQETRRWDDNKGASFAMRSKENAQDYRYFPEPDLVPVEISEKWIERVRKEMPELPDAKKARYLAEYGLPEYDVDIITGSKYLVEIFETALDACHEAKEVSNWIMGEVLRMATETKTEVEDIQFDFANLGKLILLVKKNIINRPTAKEVFEKMFTDNVDPEQYVKENGLEMLQDDNLVREVVVRVLADNPKSIAEWKEGNEKVTRFLMGQCMKQLKGKANPGTVNDVIAEELAKM